MNWDTEFIETLLIAPDFRQFLLCFFQKDHERRAPKPLSYQRFADLAGFASKSFMADVIAGRKQLTQSSFERTVLALKLNRTWREYLFYLIARDNAAFRLNFSSEEIEAKITELNRSLKAKRIIRHSSGDNSLVKAYLRPDFPEVYAALGTIDRGASFAEIQQRANIQETSLSPILEELVKVGLADMREGRYHPVASALAADELQGAMIFHEDFMRSLSKARRRFPEQAQTTSSLFITQTFSVSSAQLPEFKRELSRLITEFSDRIEEAEGDAVAEICVSFTHNRTPSA